MLRGYVDRAAATANGLRSATAAASFWTVMLAAKAAWTALDAVGELRALGVVEERNDHGERVGEVPAKVLGRRGRKKGLGREARTGEGIEHRAPLLLHGLEVDRGLLVEAGSREGRVDLGALLVADVDPVKHEMSGALAVALARPARRALAVLCSAIHLGHPSLQLRDQLRSLLWRHRA